MTDTRILSADSAIDRIFGPVIQPQTWINILYLLASFPLGLAYFVILTIMFSMGVGLLPVFVGVFVLWAGLLVTDVLANVDRIVSNTMLGAAIPARAPVIPATPNLFDKIKATVKRPGNLRRIAYLFIRFPIGLLSFSFVLILLPVSVMLLTLPLTYTFLPVTVGTTRVETFDEAIYLCCFGAVFTLLSVHALNSCSNLSRRFAQRMLAP